MVGRTERCGRRLNVLTQVPASNGLWDGFDLGLIPDVFDEMIVKGRSLCSGIFCAEDRLSEELREYVE